MVRRRSAVRSRTTAPGNSLSQKVVFCLYYTQEAIPKRYVNIYIAISAVVCFGRKTLFANAFLHNAVTLARSVSSVGSANPGVYWNWQVLCLSLPKRQCSCNCLGDISRTPTRIPCGDLLSLDPIRFSRFDRRQLHALRRGDRFGVVYDLPRHVLDEREGQFLEKDVFQRAVWTPVPAKRSRVCFWSDQRSSPSRS